MHVVITSHHTILTVENGVLCHRKHTDVFDNVIPLFKINKDAPENTCLDSRATIYIGWDEKLVIRKGDFFGCAEPNRRDLLFDRKAQGPWETFTILEEEDYFRRYRPYEDLPSVVEMSSFLQGCQRLLDLRPDREGDNFNNAPFDRIILYPAETCEQTIALIARCVNMLSADGVILIERCGTPEASKAVVSLAANGIAWPTLPDKQRQSPCFQFISPAPRRETRTKKVILVAVFGSNARAEWAISKITTADYAKRIGAELLVIEGDLLPTEQLLAKVRALDHAPADARVLLLDTDIIIRDNAPDLFEIVPDNAIGVFVESLYVDRADALSNTLSLFEVASIQPYYANTGVLLLPQDMVISFRTSKMPSIMYIDEMYEQNYFNAIFHRNNFNIFNISSRFNCMSGVSPKDISEAYFVHFAGGSTIPQSYIAWEETESPELGTTIRAKRYMSPKDVRIFDLRNERASANNTFDVLFSANRAQAKKSKLILRSRRLFYECPANKDDTILFFPVGKLKSGVYIFDLLLSPKTLDYNLYISPTEDVEFISDVDHINIMIASGSAGQTLIQKARAQTHRGTATVEAKIEEDQEIGFFIYGAAVKLEIYGLRVRREINIG